MTTVLTFHRVVDRLEQDHDLTWDSFRRLTDSVSASIADLESPSSARAIAMTFDDGTEDHLRAAEDLRRLAFPLSSLSRRPTSEPPDASTLHKCTSSSRRVMRWDPTGSPLAARSAAEQLREEVRESRARLEAICEGPVVFFAPPGGIGHPALVSTLRSEAYRACRPCAGKSIPIRPNGGRSLAYP